MLEICEVGWLDDDQARRLDASTEALAEAVETGDPERVRPLLAEAELLDGQLRLELKLAGRWDPWLVHAAQCHALGQTTCWGCRGTMVAGRTP